MQTIKIPKTVEVKLPFYLKSKGEYYAFFENGTSIKVSEKSDGGMFILKCTPPSDYITTELDKRTWVEITEDDFNAKKEEIKSAL